MSFGTGHNETTQLILELMADNISNSEKYMLDFGCGTGILAIAGVKLGIEKAIAIDIDQDSVENAGDYFKHNNVEDKITVYKSDITGINEDKFDVICANITSGIIIPNLKNIYNKMKSEGKLFITGILIEEKPEMLNELEKNGFIIKNTQDKAEWTGIYSVKR
jgi:ribosomal protein L11 methyltransferase